MKRIIIFLVIIFLNQNTFAEEFSGLPKIIDGDTIHINKKKFRLEGIDAPETRQKCKKNQKEYFCGLLSKNILEKKIKNLKVKCIISGVDRYKRYLATCYRGDVNLNKWMVRSGHAVAYKRYSKKYLSDENFAKSNKLGMWSGSFLVPEKWRKMN